MKLPSFFACALPITAEDRKFYEKNASCWARLHKQMPKMTERQLLATAAIELEGSKRPEIIGRCLRRFNRIRMDRELKELWNVAPGAGTRGGELA